MHPPSARYQRRKIPQATGRILDEFEDKGPPPIHLGLVLPFRRYTMTVGNATGICLLGILFFHHTFRVFWPRIWHLTPLGTLCNVRQNLPLGLPWLDGCMYTFARVGLLGGRLSPHGRSIRHTRQTYPADISGKIFPEPVDQRPTLLR